MLFSSEQHQHEQEEQENISDNVNRTVDLIEGFIPVFRETAVSGKILS